MLDNVILEIMKRESPLNGYYALRWKILERDKFTCQCCGQSAPNAKLEVDHIIPIAENGTDEESNLRTTCYACNQGRNGLQIILKSRRRPYSPPFARHRTYMQDLALEIIKNYPNGIESQELARQLNITSRYATVLFFRLYHSDRINRIREGVYTLKEELWR